MKKKKAKPRAKSVRQPASNAIVPVAQAVQPPWKMQSEEIDSVT